MKYVLITSADKAVNKWSQKVKVVHWDIPEGTFNTSGANIAKVMKKISKGNITRAIRRITFYKNRGGKNISEKHLASINKAIVILQKERKKT